MAWLSLVFWPVATVLMAAGQGLLMPAIRRTAPGPEAKRQAFALHYVLAAAWALPIGLCPTWPSLLSLAASRALLFDVVLNYAAGDTVFAVGATALWDRAMRWAAKRLNWAPEHLQALLWVVALLGTLLALGWCLLK